MNNAQYYGNHCKDKASKGDVEVSDTDIIKKLGLTDHDLALFVNELRDISQVMGHTQQLRERIKECVFKFLGQ